MRKNFRYDHSLYTVQAVCGEKSSHIDVLWRPEEYMTSQFPRTLKLLKKRIPGVLTTQCFNPQNLTFAQEAKNTEIGHLFEHILLEYMCQLKIAAGFPQASFCGRTYWNAGVRPQWFLITVTADYHDCPYFSGALARTLAVFNELLSTQPQIQTDSPVGLSVVATA